MNDRIADILNKPWTLPASVGFASLMVGAGAGFIYAKRQCMSLIDGYREVNDELTDKVIELGYELEQLRANQLTLDFDKTGEVLEKKRQEDHIQVQGDSSDTRFDKNILGINEVSVPVKSVETLDHPDLDRDIVVTPRGDPSKIVLKTEDDSSRVSIFRDETPSEWNYEAELSTRTKEAPYIIHRDEYENEEMGYHQSTLTYYIGDDILVDEKEVPIYNHSSLVGELKFGHGSEDQNVVYIRNERYQAEYEVLRDPGLYQVEVLGYEIENQMAKTDLKHSRHPTKFRED